jgi:hypothetical protein
MYMSFAQYVAAIVLDDEAVAKSQAATSAAAVALQTKKPKKQVSSSSSTNATNEMSQNDSVLGNLFMMGNITKKLVITPDYPIGWLLLSLSLVLSLFLLFLLELS